MTDTDHNVPEKYAALQDLTVEELEKLLYNASPDSKEDEAYYAAIEEVLLQKETENPTGRVPNPDDAWKSFRQNYFVPEAAGLRLSEELPDSRTAPAKGEKNRKPKGLRRLLPVAAALAFVLLSSAVVQVSGIDIFGAIARWTKDVFSFSNPATKTDEYGFGMRSISPELSDALTGHGFPASFAPAWLPEEYTHYEVRAYTVNAASVIEFSAAADDGSIIFINFTKYLDGNTVESEMYEKSECEAEVHSHGTQLFHIFSSASGTVAAWSDGTYVINIFGDLSINTVKEIIDSI